MEIKLKTKHSNTDLGDIVDEHGALWSFSGAIPAFGIFPATTKGPNCEIIRGFYQNGRVFILDFGEAQKYFSIRQLEDRSETHCV